jgi:hypothetical protein
MMYNLFPGHLQEEWCGFNAVGDGLVPVGAVVPKFYGYYVPEKDENDEGDRGLKNVTTRPRYESPILLLEECGKPVIREQLVQDEK